MKRTFATFLFLLIFLASCSLVSDSNVIRVDIEQAGVVSTYEITTGLSVEQALTSLGFSLNTLDYTIPEQSKVLTEDTKITIIRVTEDFFIEDSILPFEQQTVKNESIPQGETLLIQAGVNGVSQNTYRILNENGIEISRNLVKTEIIDPGKPEIIMVGINSPFSTFQIPGKLVYISEGNAWVVEENTGNRRVLTTSGDLDGRVFTLSHDRNWLMYSRNENDSSDSNQINSLWLINTSMNESEPVDLGIENVVHFAEFLSGRTRTFAFSSVEPVSTPPGWQANNDLVMVQFDVNGKISTSKTLLETNAGGQYGWWGTNFAWSPDNQEIAYARPDSIGLIDIENGVQIPLVDFVPYQPKTDWAWIPGLSWAPDGTVLFVVLGDSMVKPTFSSSVTYDLAGITIDPTQTIILVQDCGLFSYPQASPTFPNGNYHVAYLEAILNEESETSRYSLHMMDRDGSNKTKLFPNEGIPGLEPQQVSWGPVNEDDNSIWLAFISQGNLYLGNTTTSEIRQISGDGSISKVTWR